MSLAQQSYRVFEYELADLVNTLLAGGAAYDRVTAERAVRVAEAMAQVLARHPVDDLGRCQVCRRLDSSLIWVWRPRGRCTVSDALTRHLLGRNRSR